MPYFSTSADLEILFCISKLIFIMHEGRTVRTVCFSISPPDLKCLMTVNVCYCNSEELVVVFAQGYQLFDRTRDITPYIFIHYYVNIYISFNWHI